MINRKCWKGNTEALGDSQKLPGIVSVVCGVCRVTSEQARKGEEQSSLWSLGESLQEALTQS